MISAVILAGGRSERMGSAKALLSYQGETFLDRVVGVVDRCPEIASRIVVAGRHFVEISSHARVPVVYNARYGAGMATSFQAGIRGLPACVNGIVVFLVDHPMVTVSTVRAILKWAREADIVVPVHAGRRGHPVFFSRTIMREILCLPDGQGVHTLVRRDAGRVREVPVDDPGILVDIDTPQDLANLKCDGRSDTGTGR